MSLYRKAHLFVNGLYGALCRQSVVDAGQCLTN